MKKIALYLILLTIIHSCETKKDKDIISGQFAHTVLIWLNSPTNEADRSKIETGMKTLVEKSEFIRSAHMGEPAHTARDIVDNSYTYCLIVTFDSKEAQDSYQVEPVHKQFIADCKNLWSKVLIYDSINQLKESE